MNTDRVNPGALIEPDRGSESLLERVLTSLADALFVFRPENGIPVLHRVNRAAERMTGLDEASLIGAPLADLLVDAHDAHDAEELLAKVRLHGVVRDRELSLFRTGGREVPVRATLSLLTACEYSGDFESCPSRQAGKPHCPERLEGYLLVATDLSEIRRAERGRNLGYRVSELVHSAETMDDLYRSVHELLRGLMSAESFSIALFGADGPKRIAFPYSVEAGGDPQTARKITRALSDLIVRRDEPLLVTGRQVEELLHARSIAVTHVPWVRWLGVPLRVDGRVTGMIVVATDGEEDAYGEEERELLRFVSGQVAIAIERKQSADERVRLSSAVQHAADAILVTGPEGIIEYVNPAFEAMSGYTRDEVLGQTPRLLKSGRHSVDFYREIWATLSRGESWTGRMTNRRRDGSFYEVEAAFSAIRDATGRFVNYVSVQHDVTHEVALEAQLLQSQKMEAVGKLAGGVAHDFNNILSIIMGYSDLVLTEVEEDSLVATGIEEIREAGLRAGALTRQLLAFSRRQLMRPKVLDLNAVVEDTEKMLRRLIGEDVELVTKYDPDIGFVRADPGQIEQVVMNLAVNARDAMPGGGTLTLTTGTVDLRGFTTDPDLGPGEYVQLVVTDDGCGMEAEVQARIFEPFYTTKEDGRGTGLGLSTAYGILRQSDGHIAVHSRPGRGTTFRILLPLVDAELACEDVEEPLEAGMAGEETVLLVEDEDAVRDLTKEMLSLTGYRVVEAKDGVEALTVCRDAGDAIDLLLTDVIMPRMGGRELARKLAEESPDTRILFMSGYTDAAIASEGVFGRNVAFLQKPFGLSGLTRKVREVLDGPPWRAGAPIG
ncbi:MAG: PAS domain S-box protein [Planctomycetota bacterium]